jgi:protein-S-isoprenylcysteine O-methyltransferase Ste14
MRRTRRCLSDWVGFTFYLVIAINILLQAPVIGVLMLPTLLHELTIAVAFLMRSPLRQQSGGLAPRVAAYCGSFMLLVFMQTAQAVRPGWLAPTPYVALIAAGLTLWLFGALFGLWTVWHMRRAFSLVPQARELVTAGPYRLARHPIYLGYIFQYTGMLLAFWSLPFAVVLLAWLGVTLLRIHFEEALLASSFPEYESYRGRVGCFWPVLRPGTDAAVARSMTHAA